MADNKTGPVKPPIIDAKARKAEEASAAKSDTRASSGAQTESEAQATSGAQSKSGTENRTGTTGQTSQTAQTGQTGSSSAAQSSGASKAGTEKSGPKSSNTGGPSDGHKPRAAASGASPAPRAHTGAFIATGLGGAVLGLALAYALAVLGLWPTPAPETDTTAALQSRIADLEAAFEGTADVSAQLETQILDLDSRVDTLADEIAGLDLVAPDAFDALSARVEELVNAVNAVSAGASGEEAARIGADIAALQSELDAIGPMLETLDPTLETLKTEVESLEARTAELESALADQPEIEAIAAERDRFAQIPQIIATLERQMAAGAPFAATLDALETTLPDLDIAQPVRAASTTGIAAPDAIAAELRAAMPELLAARPQDPDAGFWDTLMNQAQAAIALRPAGAIAGDSPDARIARAETALANEDLATAHEALAGLPQSMQPVAAPIVSKLAAARAAQTLLEAARNAGTGGGEAAQ